MRLFLLIRVWIIDKMFKVVKLLLTVKQVGEVVGSFRESRGLEG